MEGGVGVTRQTTVTLILLLLQKLPVRWIPLAASAAQFTLRTTLIFEGSRE